MFWFGSWGSASLPVARLFRVGVSGFRPLRSLNAEPPLIIDPLDLRTKFWPDLTQHPYIHGSDVATSAATINNDGGLGADRGTPLLTPCFERVVGPDMRTRELLGLPQHYCELQQWTTAECVRGMLPDVSTALLRETLEEPALPLRKRGAAGALLALLGDPRIVPDDPIMIDIKGGTVAIGLAPDRVDPVLQEMA